MPRRAISILAAMIGFVAPVLAQPCATGFQLSTSPLPQNGTYNCGQTVTFCLTVTGWNSTNANWFHGVSATFGPGWNLSTLTPGPPPPTCGGSGGTWGWYNAVQGTAGTNIGQQGPGFFFDLDNDGNPGNNFGDFCVGATNWQFCWTIAVLNPPACVNGLNLGVSFNTFGDSETGSWGSSACGNDPIVPSPPAVVSACNVNAGGGSAPSFCSTGAPVSLVTLLTGTPNPGGSWTAPNGAAHGPTFNPALDLPGTYIYTVGTPPCTAQSQVQIAVSAPPNAGSNASLDVCTSSPPTALVNLLGGAAPGGTWTGPTGAPFSGILDPAVNASGNYTYLVTGTAPCPNASATVNVNITPAPSAGGDAAANFCSSSANVDMLSLLAGTPDAGGNWTAPGGLPFGGSFNPAVDLPGIYTYTVGTPPCTAQAQVQIAVTAPPNAGSNASLDVCSSSPPTALVNLLGGAAPGGSWTGPSGAPFSGLLDPAVNASGIYTYLVTGTAPCPNASATVNVNITPAPSAGGDAAVNACSTNDPIDLFGELSGTPAAGGTWTGPDGTASGQLINPANAINGTYTYTIPATATCPADVATVNVTIVQQPSAGSDNNVIFCRTAGIQPLLAMLGGTPAPGGVWTSPSGGASGGSINTATGTAGSYTYSVTPPAPCVAVQAVLDITLVDQPDAGPDGALLLCATGSPVPLSEGLAATADGGGLWTAPDGSPTDDQLDPASDVAGNYVYTIPANAPCIASTALVEVAIVDQPEAGNDASISICSNSDDVDLLPLLGPSAQAGGSWMTPSGGSFSGTWNAANDPDGAYTYTITAPSPCTASSAVVTVSVVDAPEAGSNGSITACATGPAIDLFDGLSGSPDAGGIWTDAGGTAVQPVLAAANAASGIYTYTVAGTAPCAATNATVTLTMVTVPNSGTDGALTACNDGTSTWALIDLLGGTPQTGGAWTAPDGTAHGPLFDPAVDPAGIYVYTITAPAPCPTVSSSVEVGISTPVPTGTTAAATLCSNSPPQPLIDLLDPSLPAGGTWIEPGGGSTGPDLDPSSMPDGTYTYVIQAPAPCPNGVHELSVTTVTLPDAGNDASVSACSSDAPIDLLGSLGGNVDAGGSWLAPDGSATTGTQDPLIAESGVYSYVLAPIGPCPGDTSTVDLTVTSAAWSGIGASIELCRSAELQSPIDWLSGLPDPGGVWTDPSGATITVADPSTMASGQYTYTVPGNAPCPSVSSTVAVTLQELPEAGDDLQLSACLGSAAINLSALVPPGADGGGSWYDLQGIGVTELFTSTVGTSTLLHVAVGIGPCANEADSSLLQWTVNRLPEVTLTAVDLRGCVPLEVQFSANVDGSVTEYDWDFGNGGTSDVGPTTAYTYVQDGLFTASIAVTDTNGCSASALLPESIIASAGAAAEFYAWPARISVQDPSFTVEHDPVVGVSYQWSLGTDTLIAAGTFRWTVEDAQAGTYPVCLIATDSLGCSAVNCTSVLIDDALTVYVPNAFTPDGDDVNDTFMPSILGLDPDTYRLLIFDRWGQEVFSSIDHTEPWNGTAGNGGEPLPQGVYVWRLLVRDNYRAETKEFFGTVTLVK
jgi:gliding motility-associated-like protein